MADAITRPRLPHVEMTVAPTRARTVSFGLPELSLLLAVAVLVSLARVPTAMSSELAGPRATPFSQTWISTAKTASTLSAIDPGGERGVPRRLDVIHAGRLRGTRRSGAAHR